MSDWMIRDSELDSIQKQILNMSLDCSATITGCAGSGKSLLALHKARQVMNQNQSYTVIVYTRALKEFFAGGIIDLGLTSRSVTTFYSWSRRPVDYIIVDEAQDFSRDEIEEMLGFAKKGIFLFGDDAQQLYKNVKFKDVVNSMSEVASITSSSSISLQTNHRLTKEVGSVAEYLNIGLDDISKTCYKKGEKPYLVQVDPCEDEVEYINGVISNHGLKDVAILLSTNDLVEEYQDMFLQAGVQVEINTRSQRELNFKTSHPKLMTYHSAKGLQFDTVFMPNIDQLQHYQKIPAYVAMTRSSNNLYLFSRTRRPSILSRAPSTLFNDPNQELNFDF